MTGVRLLEVSRNEDGQRLDNYLLRHCPGVPKSHIYRIIRKGEVRVDGKRAKAMRRLVAGEQVRIPPLRMKSTDKVRVPDDYAARAAAAVVFESADMLALAKPAGVAVHAGSGIPVGLIDALRQARDEPGLELVHRLDRATSGLLLVARNGLVNRELQALFRERRVEKRYLALVAGQWPATLADIDAPLSKNVAHAGERRVMVDPEGQPAQTAFTIVARLAGATLLDVTLHTGRTHQIRVHARHAGHPVIGDERYGDNRINRAFREQGLGRLFLHSRLLAFEWRGERLTLDVPVDEAWQAAIDGLDS
ncbi:MAG: hypothetical protein CSB44_09075 [Gammaproteobacteria bacterium]|nr:MAG: hypothetical protein CSB44_09075 [Gammaproteobacteria bacterium]